MSQVGTAPREARRPGLPTAGRIARLLALTAAVVLLWPLHLGGLLGGVIVSGHSMEPTLLPGDLAVMTRVSDADVGDVVVFRPDIAPEARVVHRVVGIDGEKLQLRGDNNDWDDPFDVDQHDVVGRVVLRVPHVGGWLTHLAAPQIWAPLLLVGSGWWLLSRRAEARER